MKTNNAEELARKLIFDVVVKAAIVSAIAQFPILGVTGIRSVFSFIVEKVASLIYDQVSIFLTFKSIEIKNAENRRDYEEATARLKTILETPSDHYDHGPEGEYKKGLELEKAKEEYKRRLASLIRFN